MRKLLIPTVGLLLALWLILGSWWYANKNADTNSSSIPTFSINNTAITNEAGQTYFFPKSEDRLMLNQQMEKALTTIAEYLKSSDESSMLLTGIYDDVENSKNDLGQSRAEEMRAFLIQKGAPNHKIEVNSLKVNNATFIDGKIYNAIYFTFNKNQEKESTAKPTSYSLNSNPKKIRPLNLYFSNSKSELKLTPELSNYFDQLKSFLASHPKSKIKLIGHSDDRGKREWNLRLSKYRARGLRDFMLENGFNKNRIVIDYKGPDEPLKDNNTEEGRKKNRRVELRIIH